MNTAPPILFVNGQFVSQEEAKISVMDRGFLFSDSVYEVSLVINSQLIDNQGHLARLEKSLKKTDIRLPYSLNKITQFQQEIIKKNQIIHGGVYLQITRGIEPRRDFMPKLETPPSLVLIPQHNNPYTAAVAKTGITVTTFPDIRWSMREIKATSLLGAVFAKKHAKQNGFDDAWFVEDDMVTEGSSNNAFIIKDKTIITKPADNRILKGITRQAVFTIAKDFGYKVIERSFSIDEAKQADEAFVSSATLLIAGVVKIEETFIGDGKPGEITQAIRAKYLALAEQGQFK